MNQGWNDHFDWSVMSEEVMFDPSNPQQEGPSYPVDSVEASTYPDGRKKVSDAAVYGPR